nr:hypothetical protein [Tanacetum cinerariifolium]
MPSHIKTYDGSEDPEDHIKIFQAAAKTERWAMPTWCHMFNSRLTGNARKKKCIKDPIEIHNIKQQDEESTKDFVRRYKLESRDVKGAPECMRIFGFVHGITNPELIKRLHDKIPKTLDEMMRVTTSFLRGKWQPRITSGRSRFHHGNNKRVIRSKISRKEASGTSKGRKRSRIGHNRDECMHLKKQIKEMPKAGKLSHLIKELKQNNGKEQPNTAKKGKTSGKDEALAILMIGDEEHSTSVWMNFEVVRSPSPYNEIIRKPGFRKLQAVSSTAHGMLKLPVKGRVITLKSSRMVPLECAVVSGPEGNLSVTKQTVEERINPADMTGVPRHIAKHRLNVREGCSPVRQKKRGQAADRNQAIQEEVGKLVEAGIIKENLNKACPKDGYPLPEIDWKVESLCGFSFKCFLDAYKGYYQIQMAKEDEKNSVHYKPRNILLYKDVFRLEKCRSNLLTSGGQSIPQTDWQKSQSKSDFHWTAKAEEAFKQMKQLIAELPMLAAPMEKENLIVYLAAAKETGIKRSENKLHINGKISAGLGTCQQVPKKILSSTPNHREYAIHYRPRVSVKGQILADFIVERPEEDSPDTLMEVEEELPEPWILKVPRSENKKTDALSKIASTSFAHLSKQVLVEELKEKSISEVEILVVVEEEGDTWTTSIFEYLAEETLPADVRKARAVRRKSWRFVVLNGILYKKSFLGPWLREQAAIREAKSKAKMEKYYNSKVRSTSFKPKDLVYRNNDASGAEDTGKLGPKWEGPYEVTKTLGKGAYKLRDRDGKQLPRTWNVSNLKKCHINKM